MNIEMVLQGLAGQMLSTANKHMGRLHICWFNDELRCHRAGHTGEKHTVFGVFMAYTIQEGLTAEQWNALRTKISNFLKEKQ